MNVNEISSILDVYLKYINIKRNEIKVEIEKGEKGYRKQIKKELDKFLHKKSENWKVEKN